MNFPLIPKVGTTIARKRFWDAVRQIVLDSRKLEGRNVSVDVHEGSGTVISIGSQAPGRGGTPFGAIGACCHTDGSCEIDSRSHCEATEGEYQGDGTTCEDEGIDCSHTGACCIEGECSIKTQTHCEDAGGEYQGDGTTCDPNPCTMPACEGCGFEAFDGSGRMFLTRTRAMTSFTASFDGPPVCPDSTQTASGTSSKTETYNTLDCSIDCECTGSVSVHSVDICPDQFCDDVISPDSCSGQNVCGPSATDTLADASGCHWSSTGCNEAVVHGCAAYGTSVTVISPTEKEIDYDYGPDGAGQFVHAVVIETLSDECDPDGFSPLP